MIDYCEAFKAWLKTDRKEQPPCFACADASSRRRRADEMHTHAQRIYAAADEAIKREHP